MSEWAWKQYCVKAESDCSCFCKTKDGLWQGGALACQLFNIRKSHQGLKNTNETHYLVGLPVFLCMLNIFTLLLEVNSIWLKVFLDVEAATKTMCVVISQERTKFIKVGGPAIRQREGICIGDYTFERVDSFIYLDSLENITNNVGFEESKRIVSANRCYFGLKEQLKSQILSRSINLLLYKTSIRLVLMYMVETLAVTKGEENLLNIFERKVLRRIFAGAIEGGQWRDSINCSQTST